MVILPESPPSDIPAPIQLAVKAVVDYLWEDELSDFQASASHNRDVWCSEHVFVALCWLRTYFEATHHDPQQYMQQPEERAQIEPLPADSTRHG